MKQHRRNQQHNSITKTKAVHLRNRNLRLILSRRLISMQMYEHILKTSTCRAFEMSYVCRVSIYVYVQLLHHTTALSVQLLGCSILELEILSSSLTPRKKKTLNILINFQYPLKAGRLILVRFFTIRFYWIDVINSFHIHMFYILLYSI